MTAMDSLFDLNWPVPDQIPPLHAGAAHVWVATIDQPLAVYFELKSFLSSDELAKAAGFRNEQARRQFLLGRGLLRKLLGIYLDEHPAELSFIYGEHGKPLLFHSVRVFDLQFNVSHAGELVLLGFVRGHQIGVDVEQMRSISEAEAIAERFFSPDEVRQLHGAGERERELFFKIWTRKEALLKCDGAGFGGTPLDPGEATICELQPAPGYVAAVVIAGSGTSVQAWRWVPEIRSWWNDKADRWISRNNYSSGW